MKYNEYSVLNSKFIAHRREKDGVIQDLSQHLKETSELSGLFASQIGLRKHGELIGLLHDLGKASVEFDCYIRSSAGLIEPDEDDYVDAQGKKGKIDHSSAGAQIISKYLTDKSYESMLVSQILFLTVASHHSGLIDCITVDGNNNFTRRLSKSDEKTRVDESWANLDDEIKCKIEELLADTSVISLLKQTIALLREENDSLETYTLKVGLLTRYLFSCLIDADRLSTSDFEFPDKAVLRNQSSYTSWTILKNKLELELGRFKNLNKIDNLRKEISDYCFAFSSKPKGLYQLTVPTGGGKTLASLRFALNHADIHKIERIIYVIPYTSIIDQNAQRVREIFEEKTSAGTYPGNIVLEHHSNLTPDEESTRQRLLSENWDAPVVFTTMVQFMESLFGYGTRNPRRMHQLANAVIIFDEIQTIPIRCVQLFNMAIRFLIKGCGSTVVLCTATQPLLDRIEPIQRALEINPGQQMMPDVQKLFKELKRVEVFDKRKTGGWTELEVVELAKQELNHTGSVLIVVNIKASAINLYNILANHNNDEVFHLSTNMCPAHRMDILGKVKDSLSKSKHLICISTQLIEAGVDIDFGTVIRYLAGLDSIAQAAGRCNRNGIRPEPGRVFIINPLDENLDKLEDIKTGRDTADRVLDEFKADTKLFDEGILGQKAMEQYYHYYFFKRKDKMCYPLNEKSLVGREDDLFELLSTNKLSVEAYKRINKIPPFIPLRQSFMTAAKVFNAIDTYTRGIVVSYTEEGVRIINELCSVKNLEEQYKLLKEAQRYSVNVFSYLFNKLLEQRIIFEVQEGAGIFYLDKQYYSDKYGISPVKVNEMEFFNC